MRKNYGFAIKCAKPEEMCSPEPGAMMSLGFAVVAVYVVFVCRSGSAAVECNVTGQGGGLCETLSPSHWCQVSTLLYYIMQSQGGKKELDIWGGYYAVTGGEKERCDILQSQEGYRCGGV